MGNGYPDPQVQYLWVSHGYTCEIPVGHPQPCHALDVHALLSMWTTQSFGKDSSVLTLTTNLTVDQSLLTLSIRDPTVLGAMLQMYLIFEANLAFADKIKTLAAGIGCVFSSLAPTLHPEIHYPEGQQNLINTLASSRSCSAIEMRVASVNHSGEGPVNETPDTFLNIDLPESDVNEDDVARSPSIIDRLTNPSKLSTEEEPRARGCPKCNLGKATSLTKTKKLTKVKGTQLDDVPTKPVVLSTLIAQP
ncbi:hypothetical protein K439DRAFT_1614622 [Ramaria rubella]|nr:hypothetical protein K439DRAFT_1614622 [Ramaria rubella]